MGPAVAGMASGLTPITHVAGGLAAGVRTAAQSLGIKGLDAGFGCGLGIGYGFGAGLMLKPSVWQGLMQSGYQLVGKSSRGKQALG